VGSDFAADMRKMAEDPVTANGVAHGPCQEPFETRASGEHWAKMEEVFFHP